ncbi:MAG: MBL fold metallo-hydrolase [Akkermansiaceae bacterium]|nr:MBL fold metallo-hydrolase [Akkermansiaceae bacterium]NNM30054.1 MBL fold metallo-hydrolase [Akkermansiaceae bacterium]
MSAIPLEDNFEDILGKALRGTGIADEVLSFLTAVPEETIAKLKDGELDEAALRKVASPLGLDAGTLVERARNSWRPDPVEIDGLRQFNTAYDDMMVNAYLVWDPASREAAMFDTGTDASGALALVDELGLKLTALYLTHTHIDHILDREAILAHSPGLPVLVNSLESPGEATRFQTGEAFSIGTLRVSTRLTKGHSPGGTTYVIHGLERPVAIVGDALFAQSMGGGMISYQDALATNRSEIFTLSDDTVVCPGHGPMTSVGEERAHNPFFPEFK